MIKFSEDADNSPCNLFGVFTDLSNFYMFLLSSGNQLITILVKTYYYYQCWKILAKQQEFRYFRICFYDYVLISKTYFYVWKNCIKRDDLEFKVNLRDIKTIAFSPIWLRHQSNLSGINNEAEYFAIWTNAKSNAL